MSGNQIIHDAYSWVLNSGASYHMTQSYHVLDDICNLKEPIYIIVPIEDVVMIKNKGIMTLDENIKLFDILYVPQFGCNLISIHKLINDLNCIVTYYGDNFVIQDQTKKKMTGSGEFHDGIYLFKTTKLGSSLAACSHHESALWHARMGHPSSQVLSRISSFVRSPLDANKLDCCDACH
uniref:Uncharacterized protein n=1 Tax=Cajanus cajan TaxID=3821 RepID=A0A151S030_CAJCA|nr:hypothetical protein KK1_030178 [Cajanus cajan]